MILLAIPIALLIIELVGAAIWKYVDDRDITTKELEKLEEDDREYWRK